MLLCLSHCMVGLITSSYCNAFCIGPIQSLVKPFTLYFTGDSVGSEGGDGWQLYEEGVKDDLRNRDQLISNFYIVFLIVKSRPIPSMN